MSNQLIRTSVTIDVFVELEEDLEEQPQQQEDMAQ